MTKSEKQLTLQEQVHNLLDFFTEPGTGEKYLKDLESDLMEAFKQALTTLTELACDKCRVRMEDKLNNGGTQHEHI